MSTVETVRALLAAIEAGEWERARSYLTDDYSFGGAVPEPIGPDAWLGCTKRSRRPCRISRSTRAGSTRRTGRSLGRWGSRGRRER